MVTLTKSCSSVPRIWANCGSSRLYSQWGEGNSYQGQLTFILSQEDIGHLLLLYCKEVCPQLRHLTQWNM